MQGYADFEAHKLTYHYQLHTGKMENDMVHDKGLHLKSVPKPKCVRCENDGVGFKFQSYL